MESTKPTPALTFTSLQARLLRIVRFRIDNGEFTERSLGRMTGISQPHIHNILKGARKLTPGMADVLLAHLGISIMMLLTPEELDVSPKKPASSVLPFTVSR